ncbi:MAG: hypothetical protein DHS20C11_07560 [Lysobacteraceae bacterium]|nr:MAG: hypothetical protein DHS20C11_07560 [Xanthomonadaceae bacterium]
MNRSKIGLMLVAALVISSFASAQDGDLISRSGFEIRTPEGLGDAGNFLLRTTYGPTPSEVANVQAVGFEDWVDAQLALAPTLHRPQLEAYGIDIGHGERQRVWFDTAQDAPDQLRQRVAFALSEILVVSDVNGTLEGQPLAVAEYYDILLRNAFGNYRDLLEEVTLTPTMGIYLSMFRSTRDPLLGIEPDENYAREIMQLFSIGLHLLNNDGTPQLDGMGQKIPTYQQPHIVALAEAFTGWNFANADNGDGDCEPWEWQWPEWNFLEPMEPCVVTNPNPGQPDDYHVTTEKTIVGDVTLPAGQTAEQDMEQALDTLFEHQNVGPFIAYRLIQRLVTSNPSPGYVDRVASVFNDNGIGMRGDLGAVVRAILLDPEALDGHLMTSTFGKLKEPLLMVTHLWRVYDAEINPVFAADRSCCWPGAIYVPQWWFSQAALRSPSVFNFFKPDYSPPGAILNAGLVAPEFQIATDTQVMDVANFFFDTLVNQPPPNFPWQTEHQIDIAALQSIASNATLLVQTINDDLMFGQLDAVSEQLIIDRIEDIDVSETTQRVTEAIYFVFTSPASLVQR